MNQKQFLFEKNDCKVYKLTVLNHSYFIVEHSGKRYIRKSSVGINGLISFLKEIKKVLPLNYFLRQYYNLHFISF